MAEEIQHTEEGIETPLKVEATETHTTNEECETKMNSESEKTPLEEEQVEEPQNEKNRFRKWIDRYTDPKQVGSFIVALVATILGGWAVNYAYEEIRHGIFNRYPYISFESDFTQVLHISMDIPNLEYSVGEKGWEKLGTKNVVFGGSRGKLLLRGRNKYGTKGANISFATDAQVICTGDIRTMVDYKQYKEANTDEANFSKLFLGCTQLVVAPELPATELAFGCYYRMFQDCTSLTIAPELPAMKLSTQCYCSMFKGCTSLTTAPKLPAMKLDSSCYASMFYGCKSLKAAPNLPAMDLAQECYTWMFSKCTSLERAPKLPAMELEKSCYRYMFAGCISLRTAPALPAKELAPWCYDRMFSGCTSLRRAPVLSAMELKTFCYSCMFFDCTSLSEITMLAADIPNNDCYDAWLDNTSPKGTFYKNKNATWDNKGIVPEGWDVVLVDPDEEQL